MSNDTRTWMGPAIGKWIGAPELLSTDGKLPGNVSPACSLFPLPASRPSPISCLSFQGNAVRASDASAGADRGSRAQVAGTQPRSGIRRKKCNVPMTHYHYIVHSSSIFLVIRLQLKATATGLPPSLCHNEFLKGDEGNKMLFLV